jgi:hypothetical protein
MLAPILVKTGQSLLRLIRVFPDESHGFRPVTPAVIHKPLPNHELNFSSVPAMLIEDLVLECYEGDLYGQDTPKLLISVGGGSFSVNLPQAKMIKSEHS